VLSVSVGQRTYTTADTRTYKIILLWQVRRYTEAVALVGGVAFCKPTVVETAQRPLAEAVQSYRSAPMKSFRFQILRVLIEHAFRPRDLAYGVHH
jgi:hypothetical protein